MDRTDEVSTGGDARDVMEDVLGAQALHQHVREPSCVTPHIGPPVTQEDTHWPSLAPSLAATVAKPWPAPRVVTT